MTSKISVIRPISFFVVMPLIFILFSNYLPIEFSSVPIPNLSISSPSDLLESIRGYVESIFEAMLRSAYWVSTGMLFLMVIIVSTFYHNHLGDIYDRVGNSLRHREQLIDAEFFVKWGHENAITELRYIEKITFVAVPVLILLNLTYYVGSSYPDIWENHLMKFFGYISISRLYIIILIANAFLLPLSFFLLYFFQNPFNFTWLSHALSYLKIRQRNWTKLNTVYTD